MPDCLLCQNYFDTDEQLATHMGTDHHYAPPSSPFGNFNIDQTVEMLLPMLQEYMNHAAHASAALTLVEIATNNSRPIEKVLESYKTALETLSGDESGTTWQRDIPHE